MSQISPVCELEVTAKVCPVLKLCWMDSSDFLLPTSGSLKYLKCLKRFTSRVLLSSFSCSEQHIIYSSVQLEWLFCVVIEPSIKREKETNRIVKLKQDPD